MEIQAEPDHVAAAWIGPFELRLLHPQAVDLLEQVNGPPLIGEQELPLEYPGSAFAVERVHRARNVDGAAYGRSR
ncbi:MAG: hypothetical protein ACTHK2_14855 [Dokdonella sp.]|uniref:hypothetical protein n=1 Tax=Dokdonella sp. TaxID=2291710 RepID=UPI003F7D3DA5